MIYEKNDIFSYDPDHPSCHCSVIQELPNGELMAVWYAGKAEAHKSVGLKASWKPLNGTFWTAPTLIHKTPKKADGNEVIIYYRNQLHLYFNTIHGHLFPWTKVVLKKKVSDDYGRTWSESQTLLGDDQKGFTVRTKPLVIGERLIIPTGQESLKMSTAQMYITEDGQTYHLGAEKIRLPEGKCHQPAITQLKDGSLLAYLRTDKGFIYQTLSSDLGETWTIPTKTDFYNPNSALDFVRTEKGEIILVWNNNAKQGGMMKSRKVLHIAYSPDEGKTWPIIKEVERDDNDGRFAYPAIILGSDGLCHLTYTNRRKTIRYVKFDLEWLKNK
jgi:predicted neuraminidase